MLFTVELPICTIRWPPELQEKSRERPSKVVFLLATSGPVDSCPAQKPKCYLNRNLHYFCMITQTQNADSEIFKNCVRNHRMPPKGVLFSIIQLPTRNFFRFSFYGIQLHISCSLVILRKEIKRMNNKNPVEQLQQLALIIRSANLCCSSSFCSSFSSCTFDKKIAKKSEQR